MKMYTLNEDVLAMHNNLRDARPDRKDALSMYIVNRYRGQVNRDGRFDGVGDMTSSMGYVYSGFFKDGQLEGEGRMVWENQYCIEGMFASGTANGMGAITWPNGNRYKGMLRNNFRHGEGTLTSKEGRAVYQGMWINGKREGYGVQVYENGNIYTGYWLQDRRHGHGVLQYVSGDCYSGEWCNNFRQGYGSMGWRSWREGLMFDEMYDGEWVNGKPHGQGICTYIFTPDTLAENDTKRGGNMCADSTKQTKQVTSLEKLCVNNTAGNVIRTRSMDSTSKKDRASDTAHGCLTSRAAVAGLESLCTYAPPVNAFLNVYRGHFSNGLRHGYGIFFYADGSSFRGQWKRGAKCESKGLFTNSAGIAYTEMCSSQTDSSTRRECDNRSVGRTLTISNLHITDMRGINDASCGEFLDSMAAVLLRVNTTLKGLFHLYALKCDDVALVITDAGWWRHRLPGHIAIPQLLRLLSDKNILQGTVTTATVLTCIVQLVHAERDSVSTSERAGMDRAADNIAMNEYLNTARIAVPRKNESIVKGEGNDESFVELCYATGSLNYRQFGEVLVRLAPHVCVGECYPTLKEKFTALVQDYLQAKSENRPLYPMTRRYQSTLLPYLPALKIKFRLLAEFDRSSYDEDDKQKQLCRVLCFVHARTLVVHLIKKVIDHYSFLLMPTLSALFPCLHIPRKSVLLFPGVNQPTSAITQTFISQGCGKDSSLLVSGVLAHHRLTFVDFVETVLTLSSMISEKNNVAIQDVLSSILFFLETAQCSS